MCVVNGGQGRAHVCAPPHAAAHAVGREGKITKANILTSNLPHANHGANVLSHTLFTTPLEANTNSYILANRNMERLNNMSGITKEIKKELEIQIWAMWLQNLHMTTMFYFFLDDTDDKFLLFL